MQPSSPFVTLSISSLMILPMPHIPWLQAPDSNNARGENYLLESEKVNRKREKMENIEVKVKALMDKQKVVFDCIEAEYREQLAGL
ncbi:hypothetical protein ACS0TY_016291 [Phlomoides rotata]